ncbi:MAG: LysR family transcriptional regulator [Hyphomonadaceae bacterium]
MDVEIKLLKGFVEVAREGSFTRAAKRLNLTQSALTLQVRKLESMLGVALFERTPRAVSLAPAGRELLPIAERMVHENTTLRSVIQRLRAAENQYLHVGGASYTIELPERYDFLEGFLRENPKCTLRVDPRGQPELAYAVQEGELDAAVILGYGVGRAQFEALTRSPQPSHGVYPTDLCCAVLARRRVELLVPPESPLARLNAIAPEHLRGQRVAAIEMEHSPPLFEPLIAYLESGGAIVETPPEGIPVGVERYARRERIAAISLGFFPPTASPHGALVARPLLDFSGTTDLVVIAKKDE